MKANIEDIELERMFRGIDIIDKAVCYGFLYIDKENKYWILSPKNTNEFIHADEVMPHSIEQLVSLQQKGNNNLPEQQGKEDESLHDKINELEVCIEGLADEMFLLSKGEEMFADTHKQNWTLDYVKRKAAESIEKYYYNYQPKEQQGKELFEWVKASEGDNVEIRGINFCKNCGSIIHSSCEYCDDSCKMAKDHRSVELFTFVKASDELPEKMGKYWIRYRNYAGIQLTGSFFDGFKFPHHQGTIEWLKPVKLNQPTR